MFARIVRAPAYAASYIINGDASGITEEERKAVDAYLEGLDIVDIQGEGLDIVDIQGEPYFTWSFRLYGGLHDGGEILDYVALIP